MFFFGNINKGLEEYKNKPIFLYCLHGSRRAAGILKNMGYGNVKSIAGISRYKGTIE